MKKISPLILIALVLTFFIRLLNTEKPLSYITVNASSTPFILKFDIKETLEESGEMSESSNAFWWLNSGGTLVEGNNVASTALGEIPNFSKWRLLYRISNPSDTDQGYHPQNLFRLVSRTKWLNFSEEAYFRILKDNLSESINRNASNGLFLMMRYLDGDNLYYAGVRVDGTVVIKKKMAGKYVTLARENIFEGVYNRDLNPNLLPKYAWIGLKSEIENVGESVVVRLYLDLDGSGKWNQALEVIDAPNTLTGEPITETGFLGIRTDFMDVEFRDYKIISSV